MFLNLALDVSGFGPYVRNIITEGIDFVRNYSPFQLRELRVVPKNLDNVVLQSFVGVSWAGG